MGVNVTSGNVTANVVSQAATYLTATILSGRQTGTGTFTLGTVPANKRWRIVAVSIQCTAGSTAQVAHIDLNGVQILGIDSFGTATVTSCAANNLTFNIAACPTIAATQTVQLVTSASVNTNYTVVYYEESV